jgi:hypothetical protein
MKNRSHFSVTYERSRVKEGNEEDEYSLYKKEGRILKPP